MTKPRALVLLSGGLDSATCLAIARAEGYDVYALSVEYGQRHAAELAAAQRVAKARIAEYHLTERCPVLLAPVQGQLKPADLAAWILRDRLPVRMQVQLHKVIWGNEPGR